MMTSTKTPLCQICEDGDMLLVLLQGRSVAFFSAFYCHCGILGLWRKKPVWLAPPICFVFHHGTLREWRTSLYVSQTVWDGMFTFFETLRKETGLCFWKPWGMCMWKPVWATGISSKRRNKAQVYKLHHRSGDAGFLIRNAMKKVFIVCSLTKLLFFGSCDSPTRS